MACIDKTYAKTWDEYKEVLDWCKSIGIVTDEYGNRLYPYSWLHNPQLTKNDFGNDKWHTIWNTGPIQDLYIIRHCPCNVVQERMREVYPPYYIKNVLDFNTEYDKFKRPENKNPHFTIIWKKKPTHKTKNLCWVVNAYSKDNKLFDSYEVPFYSDYEDRWYYPYDNYYTEDRDYTLVALRGILTPRRLYRKLRKWGLPKGTKLNFRTLTKSEDFEFDLIIK